MGTIITASYGKIAQLAHLRKMLLESYDEQGGLSQGVELPQHVVACPHLGEPALVPFKTFGAEINFLICLEPHTGHASGVFPSLSRTSISATLPHAAQRNS